MSNPASEHQPAHVTIALLWPLFYPLQRLESAGQWFAEPHLHPESGSNMNMNHSERASQSPLGKGDWFEFLIDQYGQVQCPCSNRAEFVSLLPSWSTAGQGETHTHYPLMACWERPAS